MKKLLFVLLLLAPFLIVDAQSPSSRSKPRAKFSKTETRQIRQVVTRVNPKVLKGPAAKNQIRTGQVSLEKSLPVTFNARLRLKGPGAKNYLPQIKKSNPNIFRHSSRNE